MSAREEGHGATGTDPLALMGPEVRAVVEKAIADPAVETVSTDGVSVWISGRPSSGRTDMLRRLLPSAEEGGCSE